MQVRYLLPCMLYRDLPVSSCMSRLPPEADLNINLLWFLAAIDQAQKAVPAYTVSPTHPYQEKTHPS